MKAGAARPLVAQAAGGTGGHVFPAQAIAAALRDAGFDALLLTDRRGAEFADPPFEILPAASIRGSIAQRLRGAAILAGATLAARRLLVPRRAALLIGFGGYPAFAPCLAARWLRLPIILHEQATTFSLANRKLLPLASRIALPFPIEGALDPRIRHVGPAVRPAIAAVAHSPYRASDEAIELLVVGGSQSAAIFGETVPAAILALPDALRRRIRLSLQYRGEAEARLKGQLEAADVAVEMAPFFHDMAERLVRAHLVLCRAGASTGADIAAVGRPAIFVPIPEGGSSAEQLRNALAFERAGAGWHLPQEALERGALTALLERLLRGDLLAQAASASAALGRAGGAQAVAALARELLAPA